MAAVVRHVRKGNTETPNHRPEDPADERRSWRKSRLLRSPFGRRVGIGIGLAVVLSLVLTWFGLGTASAARDAQDQLQSLMDQVRSDAGSGLLEPGTYFLLAEQVETVQISLDEIDSRLGLLRPFQLLPFIGGKVSDASNTVRLGSHLSEAAITVIRAYGEELEAQRTGSAGGLSSHVAALTESLVSLDQAEARAESGTVLSASQQVAVLASIEALRNLATMALEAPTVVQDIFELAAMLDQMRDRFPDILQAISEPLEFEELFATARPIFARIDDKLTDLPEQTQASLGLSLGALQVSLLGMDAVSDLLAVFAAVELGPLTPEFGALAGAKLALARARLIQGRAVLTDLGNKYLTEGVDGSPGEPSFEPGHPLEIIESALIKGVDSIALASRALGYEGTQNYLILMQNQNEIRATGGFIGATAELRVTSGVMEALVFEDSLGVDIPPLLNNPLAPEPIYWYLWIARLLFRDANWSPNFPESAQTLMGMYESSKRVELDGALAGNKVLALDLLDIYGAIEIEDIDGPVDRALAELYVEGVLPFDCAPRHTAAKGKRCFDEDLIRGIIAKLQGGIDNGGRADLVTIIRNHLDRKGILVYSEDPTLQQFVESSGWAGAIKPPSQDFLMVVDSSLPGHTKALVSREIGYSVQLSLTDTSSADLRVRFINNRATLAPNCRQAETASGETNVDCYWNYVRVLLPSAAQVNVLPVVALHPGMEKLIWGYRDIDSAVQLTHAGGGLTDMQEVGAFVVVKPQSTVTMPINYELSRAVIRSAGAGRYEYRLLLSKQPGVDDDFMDVRIELPPGATLVTGAPNAVTFADGLVRWVGILESDVEVVVVFEAP
jgi:hypothetical protein